MNYIKIKVPNHPFAVAGFVLEHRLVCEKFIGRYLTKLEVVHHLDEVKTNNKIENLMIFPNQKEHQKFHLKIRQFGITNVIRRMIENRWDLYINRCETCTYHKQINTEEFEKLPYGKQRQCDCKNLINDGQCMCSSKEHHPEEFK